MENQLVRITETNALEDLVQRSTQKPVVIFKHSLTCPISASAFEQMRRYAGEVALVEVQRARSLSNEIEQKLGVRHESPQIIVLRNGQVVWNASHFKITADAVTQAVGKAAGEKEPAADRAAGEEQRGRAD
jgi:bacillithiol system protein YtxJ